MKNFIKQIATEALKESSKPLKLTPIHKLHTLDKDTLIEEYVAYRSSMSKTESITKGISKITKSL